MALLGVNIDHVATLREVRKVHYPNPAIAARIAQDAGADLITCHLREDRRHIRDEDIPAIRAEITIPLNLEMAATEAMEAYALQIIPDKVTLVPERREELTTEGGLDVLSHGKSLAPMVGRLKKSGITVSMFIDPDQDQLHASRECGADAVELHTGNYCNASLVERNAELNRLQAAAEQAKKIGFFVAAGHGLNYQNILPVLKIIEIQEYNIGHSIVAHAVLVGLERAVREMKALLG